MSKRIFKIFEQFKSNWVISLRMLFWKSTWSGQLPGKFVKILLNWKTNISLKDVQY